MAKYGVKEMRVLVCAQVIPSVNPITLPAGIGERVDWLRHDIVDTKKHGYGIDRLKTCLKLCSVPSVPKVGSLNSLRRL